MFFKCRLLSDIILNSKLFTEGNMTTLDYIPGSNFLGIAARSIYGLLSAEEAYEVFHSGAVSFGDATISMDNKTSYRIPLALKTPKKKDKALTAPTHLHHDMFDETGKVLSQFLDSQFKQVRDGYVCSDGEIAASLSKSFALKSAHDPTSRRSKKGSMYGFESLRKGQEFVFSVRFKDDRHLDTVTEALVGLKRIGKSRTAQYGQLEIGRIEPVKGVSTFKSGKYTLVYAQSNLCFFDAWGQPTFRPTGEDLGLPGCLVDWQRSQIRHYSYSPWNGKRNTTESQRHCIAMGSVFYVQGETSSEVAEIGSFRAEGLGRVIYNPEFLKSGSEVGITSFFRCKDRNIHAPNKLISAKDVKTGLARYLISIKEEKQKEVQLVRNVRGALKDAQKNMGKISSSQWGAIRAIAANCSGVKDLETSLFCKETGFLMHGVAEERYWGKGNGKQRNILKDIMSKYATGPQGTLFMVKFAAEMAKFNSSN